MFGRLGDGVYPASAVARLSAAASRPQAPGGLRVETTARVGITPLDVAVLARATRAGLDRFGQVLAATVGLLLIVGCAAVALLLFVRIEGAAPSSRPRLALGGSVAGLVRGLALEAAIVAGAGALAALPVAWWLLRGARAFVLPGGVAVAALGVDVDAQALGAAAVAGGLAFAAITGLARSMPPCGRRPPTCSRRRPRAGRGAAAGSGTACSRRRWRSPSSWASGALVFVASLRAALALNAPIAMETIARASLDLTPHGYDPVRASTTFASLQARLTAQPSIAAVASSVGAGGMSSSGRLAVDGAPRLFPTTVDVEAVDGHYLDTMRLPVTAGRGFAAADDAGALVAIASASLARQLGGDAGALGRRVQLPWPRQPGAPAPVATVVGIVPDVVTHVGELQPLTLYVPLAHYPPQTSRTLTGRAAAGVDPVARAMAEWSASSSRRRYRRWSARCARRSRARCRRSASAPRSSAGSAQSPCC